MIDVTRNMKHKLVLMFLYYAGLRLNEVRNLKWERVDFEREMINIKVGKGGNERVVFLHENLKNMLIMNRGIDRGLVLISESGKKYNKRTIIQELLGHKNLETT